MKRSRRHVSPVSVLLLALAAACEGDPTGTSHARAVEISAAGVFVDVGQTLELSASAKDDSGAMLPGEELTWSSSDPAILEVVAGKATGRAPGVAYVRATAGTVSDSVAVTVETPVARLLVWPADTLRLIQGREATLFVEMRDDAGQPASHSVVITSSAPGTAAIQDQTIAGTAPGSAVVTVRAGSKAAQVAVEVVSGASYVVRPLEIADVRDLNNRGWVVGGDHRRAVLWRNGVVTELPHEDLDSSVAVAVNDSGLVVITGMAADRRTPVLLTWREGVVRRVPVEGYPDEGWAYWVHVNDLNDRGEFVGYASVQTKLGAINRYFRWDGSQLRWMRPPMDSEPPLIPPAAINNRGDQVGDRFVIESGVAREISSPRPGARVNLTDINDRGQFIGNAYSGHITIDVTPFSGQGTSVVNLAALAGGYLFQHLNEYGDMIGYFIRFQEPQRGESLVVRDGKATVIHVPGLDANRSVAINDLGQLLVVSRSEPQRAFLVSPGS